MVHSVTGILWFWFSESPYQTQPFGYFTPHRAHTIKSPACANTLYTRLLYQHTCCAHAPHTCTNTNQAAVMGRPVMHPHFALIKGLLACGELMPAIPCSTPQLHREACSCVQMAANHPNHERATHPSSGACQHTQHLVPCLHVHTHSTSHTAVKGVQSMTGMPEIRSQQLPTCPTVHTLGHLHTIADTPCQPTPQQPCQLCSDILEECAL